MTIDDVLPWLCVIFTEAKKIKKKMSNEKLNKYDNVQKEMQCCH